MNPDLRERSLAQHLSCGGGWWPVNIAAGAPDPVPVEREVINTMFAIEECMWTSVPVHGGPSLDHCQHDGHH